MAINVEYEKPNFILKFPYNEIDLRVAKSLPVRNWNKKTKQWEVPELAFRTIDGLGNWTAPAQERKTQLEKAIDCVGEE